jgi:hypothetical protein
MSKTLSILRPSSFHRQLRCTASVPHDIDSPYTTSTVAQVGTTIHRLAEGLLLGEDVSSIKFETEITNEMRETADDYIKYLQPYLSHVFAEVEYDISLAPLYDAFEFENKKGTIDFVSYDDEHQILHVVDLKTGATPVIAKDNMQLSAYAYCMVKELEDNGMDVKTIVLHIHQSHHTYNINSHELSKSELFSYIKTSIHAKIQDIDYGRFSFEYGTHCTYCPNMSKCITLKNEISILDAVKRHDIDNGTKVHYLALMPVLVKVVAKYKQELEDELLLGSSIAGVKLIRGNKQRSIINEDKLLNDIENVGLTKDVAYTTKIKTVKQLEVMLKKEGRDLSILKEHVYTADGRIQIALASSNRREVKL